MAGRSVAIIGGGPAGLMAAEVLGAAGCKVTVHEAMPTVGRKFLLAGKSGLNITHAEDYHRFRTRFGAASERLRPALDAFTPAEVRKWAAGLGSETFVGSSDRVFPRAMKASPLLRSWLRYLDELMTPAPCDKSFPSFFPLFRLDRVWYSHTNLRVNARTLREASSLSDHLPILIEVAAA